MLNACPTKGTRAMEQIRSDSLVCDVVKNHPQTIVVFAHHGLNCVGCNISPFHTIADSAWENALSLDLLLGDLNRALRPVPPVLE